ncbi:MAG: endonuclease IV, partial [Oscillospiraceae bacterium]|nr:endonuclease IV [Oscillospiraceae bacterium]
MNAIFGPAGSSEAFAKAYKSSLDMPKYLNSMNLDAFEYQCGQGVRVSESLASSLKANAQQFGITLS